MVALTLADALMNGITTDSMPKLTEDGYDLRAMAGQARASSFDIVMNSALSGAPFLVGDSRAFGLVSDVTYSTGRRLAGVDITHRTYFRHPPSRMPSSHQAVDS